MTEIQLEGSGGWVKADLTDEQVKESKLVPKKVCREVNQPTHQIQQRGVTPPYQNNKLGGMILGGLVGSMIGQNESQRRICGVVGAIVGNFSKSN